MKQLIIAFLIVFSLQVTINKPALPQVQAQETKQIEAPKAKEKKRGVKHATKAKKPVKKAPVVAKSVPKPVAVPSTSSVSSIITAAANRHGIDPARALRIAQCESGLNPQSVNYNYNENGYPSGLFQHLSGYWPARAAKHGYPGASVFDPVANANVTMAMWASGSAGLWECQ